MNIFVFLGFAVLINFYLVWLTITEFDRRLKRMTCADWERDKYFDLMINELGMTYRDAKDEYNKIETYDHLLKINREMTKFLKKEKAYA